MQYPLPPPTSIRLRMMLPPATPIVLVTPLHIYTYPYTHTYIYTYIPKLAHIWCIPYSSHRLRMMLPLATLYIYIGLTRYIYIAHPHVVHPLSLSQASDDAPPSHADCVGDAAGLTAGGAEVHGGHAVHTSRDARANGGRRAGIYREIDSYLYLYRNLYIEIYSYIYI